MLFYFMSILLGAFMIFWKFKDKQESPEMTHLQQKKE